MVETVIEWDGRNVPRELRRLAPGRYVVLPIDAELTADEDVAVRRGLDELEAGDLVPLDEVIREFESRTHRS
jgi:hypothetical protein